MAGLSRDSYVFNNRREHDSMDALQSVHLGQPLEGLSLRCYFLNIIFGFELVPSPSTNKFHDGFEAYFRRYAVLCQLAANKNREIESLNHSHVAKIILSLRDRTKTKSSFCEHELADVGITNAKYRTEGSLLNAPNSCDIDVLLIDLAANLWSMLSIGKFPGDVSYDEPIQWESNQTLDELLDNHFPRRFESEDRVKLPQSFTAANLEQIGGIEIVWTSNLADHLLLKDDDTKLMLFHQVSILQLHLRSEISPFPVSLVDETIRSISLLIPPVLGEPNPWFQQKKLSYPVDASAGTCDRLNSSERQIDKFMYWRDRLVLLKRTFDDAEPSNISQLWFDDRKKTQWFTFWVAVLVFIMTVFFGVVQSVAGIVQAWASVQSLKSQK